MSSDARISPRSKRPPGSQYSPILVRHYDECFAPFERAFRKVRQRAIGHILRKARVIGDLCCGTGAASIELARDGRRVYAIDHSPHFCKIVRKKARQARVDVHVLMRDMRRFRLPEKADVIICQFDALNHIPGKVDLASVFGCVSGSLKKGGYFFFDVYTPLSHRKYWPSIRQVVASRGWLMFMRGLPYDRKRKRGRIEIRWLVFRDNRWRHEAEIIEQVSWTDKEIQAALARNRIPAIRRWTDAELGFNHEVPGRAFFLARKT